MSNYVVFEVFHLTVLVPSALPEVEDDAIRHVLDDARFRAHLRRAVRGVFRHYPELRKAKVKLSR